MFKGIKPIVYRGREVWPLIEGGKGVSATNHASSGAWAAAGGIGTISAVNADSYGCWVKKRKLITSFGSLFGAWNNKYLIYEKSRNRFTYKRCERDPDPTHIQFSVVCI